MENQINAQQNNVNAPSLHGLRCPHCNADSLLILGKKGARGKAIGIGAAFGAIGHLVANAIEKDNMKLEQLNYKCNACKKKFESLPLMASVDEILSEPCKITFQKNFSFVGSGMQYVWMNGLKIGQIKGKKPIEFTTMTKHNTLFLTDQYGMAFKKVFEFEAQPGGLVQATFKGKFI